MLDCAKQLPVTSRRTVQKRLMVLLREPYNFDLSLPFSGGEVPAARIFMNLFSVSNQNGAPKEAAIAVRTQPTKWPGTTSQSHGNARPLNSRMPGNPSSYHASTNLGFELAFTCRSDSDLQSASLRLAPRRL